MKRPAAFPPGTYCTGGWCAVRETCHYYHSPVRGDKDRRVCPSGTTAHYRHHQPTDQAEERTNSLPRSFPIHPVDPTPSYA